MPFTISHAAAALPVHKIFKRTLPLAALMIGSMAPDFAYLLPGDPGRLVTHSVAGIFSFCWPIGLGAWLLFVHLLEQPTFALMPDAWQQRFSASDRSLSIRTLALASIGIMLGAATHLMWDALTHSNSPVTDNFPALHDVVMQVGDVHLRWYGLFQVASSAFGLAVLALWFWLKIRRPAESPPSSVQPASRSLPDKIRISAVMLLFATAGVFAITNYVLHLDSSLPRRVFHLLIGGMTGWMVAWLTIALSLTLRRR